MNNASAPTTTEKGARRGLRFSARDLVNIAIFAVIYFVVVFAINMLGIISPLVMLVILPLSIIVAGIPYMLFLTRVKHPGMVTLFGTVVALLYLMSGQPWQSTVLTIVLSVIADIVLAAGGYRSKWAAIWAYTIFTFWYVGPWIPMLLNREEYLNSPGMQQMGEEYVAVFDQTVSVTALWIYALATVVCGLVGGLLGSAMLRKHFVKAGLA
jgi:energy-coupling factor transport system substrate-specific component